MRGFGKFLLKSSRNPIKRTVVKDGCALIPSDIRPIHGSHIPQVSSVLAAAWIASMKLLQLLFDLSGDQMIVVPELRCA